jgi:hypothetical protein
MNRNLHEVVRVSLLAVAVTGASAVAFAQQPAPAATENPVAVALSSPMAGVKAPQPSVPEVFTMEGQFVRVAYNNEGYVTLGYRIANDSVGDEWLLLDAGVTLREGVKYQTLLRDAFSLKTPDGTIIPLATQKDYGKAGYLPALNKRAKMMRDSIAYFPVGVNRPCTFRLFADLGGGPSTVSFDQVDLADNRACVGRVFFKVPGGIQVGQHWLIVKFATSEVQVPFRILTAEEGKLLQKNWQEFKKALDKSMTD